MMSTLDSEIYRLKEGYKSLPFLDVATAKFTNYPLSQKTLKGLSEAGFSFATEIQHESICHALLGKDIIGVAETGSGKTLAFLIPVLEHLFINKWSRVCGLGALVISPTRELAYQLFETLRKIGKYHDFSAGLIIGGKNLRFERNRMDQCNILICTPGRLLQHMDENALFDANSVELFVLDEADRCLDMGFEQCLNAIIKNLPLNRQNLLFSATQNTASYLTRLKLRNPIYVGKHWQSVQGNITAIPCLLKQNYVVVDLEKKVTMLWSFIKNHLKQKTIVFLSSCKQVKYIHEVFSKLRPGITLLALYGTMSQDRRISVYNEFFKKTNAVLFATDIASRGLDFPDVQWVVQLDCPEDVTQYIHRAGRSARHKSHGESLLVLMPSEENAMLMEFKTQKINLRKIEIDPKKLLSPDAKIKALCAWSPELKASAQRAFIAYIKSVFLMKNKSVFKTHFLDFQKFAESLGLMSPPRIRFLDRQMSRQRSIISEQETISSDDVFFKIKRLDHEISPASELLEEEKLQIKKVKKVTKISQAKKSIKKNIEVNQKHFYDEEGNEIMSTGKILGNEMASVNTYNAKSFDIKSAKSLLLEEDKFDKARFKEMVKNRHKQLKQKRKQMQISNQESEEDSYTDEIDLPFIPEKTANKNNYQSGNQVSKANFKTVEISLKDSENIASQLLSYT